MKGRGESGWGTDALGAVCSKTQDLMDTVIWCRNEGRWWRSTELGERRFGVRDRRYSLTSHDPVSGLDLILGREGHG